MARQGTEGAGSAASRFGRSRFPSVLEQLDVIDIYVYDRWVNSNQFRRYLREQGCTFEEGKKHTLVRRGEKVAALPRHGGTKQLGTGLMRAIMKALELE